MMISSSTLGAPSVVGSDVPLSYVLTKLMPPLRSLARQVYVVSWLGNFFCGRFTVATYESLNFRIAILISILMLVHIEIRHLGVRGDLQFLRNPCLLRCTKSVLPFYFFLVDVAQLRDTLFKFNHISFQLLHHFHFGSPDNTLFSKLNPFHPGLI